MVTVQYDPKKSVNHGVPGSSPGEGASRSEMIGFFVFYLSTYHLTHHP